MKQQWEVSWYLLTKSAKKRFDNDPSTYEHDHDRDETNHYRIFHTHVEAQAFARTVAGDSVYGSALVQRQVWGQEEDSPIKEWINVGESEDITV